MQKESQKESQLDTAGIKSGFVNLANSKRELEIVTRKAHAATLVGFISVKRGASNYATGTLVEHPTEKGLVVLLTDNHVFSEPPKPGDARVWFKLAQDVSCELFEVQI